MVDMICGPVCPPSPSPSFRGGGGGGELLWCFLADGFLTSAGRLDWAPWNLLEKSIVSTEAYLCLGLKFTPPWVSRSFLLRVLYPCISRVKRSETLCLEGHKQFKILQSKKSLSKSKVLTRVHALRAASSLFANRVLSFIKRRIKRGSSPQLLVSN